MKFPRVLVCLMFLLTITAVRVWGDDAETAYSQGQKLLTEGDLRGALKSYVQAVKLDRNNQQYLQQYQLARRALELQDKLSKETDAKKWESNALALRSFFNSQELTRLALPLDQQLFEKSPTEDNAITLAETWLTMERSEEAVQTLSKLPEAKLGPAGRAMLAIALARQGEREKAAAVAEGMTASPTAADAGTLYLTARMQAALGKVDEAVATLTACFAAVPPSRQDMLKSHARLCRDFTDVAASPAFAQALATQSKVAESKCSGGSSCSTCPMRGACEHDQVK